MATGSNDKKADCNNKSEAFEMPHCNMKVMMDSYKKNMEMMKLVSKSSMEICSTVAQLQSALIKQVMTDMGSAMSQSTKPSDMMSRMSEITRDSIVQGLKNRDKIKGMMTIASNDITAAAARRMKEAQ